MTVYIIMRCKNNYGEDQIWIEGTGFLIEEDAKSEVNRLQENPEKDKRVNFWYEEIEVS